MANTFADIYGNLDAEAQYKKWLEAQGVGLNSPFRSYAENLLPMIYTSSLSGQGAAHQAGVPALSWEDFLHNYNPNYQLSGYGPMQNQHPLATATQFGETNPVTMQTYNPDQPDYANNLALLGMLGRNMSSPLWNWMSNTGMDQLGSIWEGQGKPGTWADWLVQQGYK